MQGSEYAPMCNSALQKQPSQEHAKQHPQSGQVYQRRTQPSQHDLLIIDSIPKCWHPALTAVANIAAQTAPLVQQQTHLAVSSEAQLHSLSNSLLAVSKISAAGLTSELGVAVGQWIQRITDVEGSADDLMAPVIGQSAVHNSTHQKCL